MKRITFCLTGLLLTFLLGINAPLEAQVSVNSSFLVGGTISYNNSQSTVEVTQSGVTTTTDKPTTSVFTFEPVIAYFILPNLAIGGQVSFTKENVTTNGDENTIQNLLLGPIARYYFPIGDKAAIFMEIDAAFGSSSDNIEIGGLVTSTDNSIAQFGFGPGLTFFIDDLIGLEAIAKYNYTTGTANIESPGLSYKSVSDTNEFNFQVGLQFYFTKQTRSSRNVRPTF